MSKHRCFKYRCLLVVFISVRKPKKLNSKSNQKVKWKRSAKILGKQSDLDFSKRGKLRMLIYQKNILERLLLCQSQKSLWRISTSSLVSTSVLIFSSVCWCYPSFLIFSNINCHEIWRVIGLEPQRERIWW